MQQETDKLVSVVLSIQPRETDSGGGKSPEDIVLEITADQAARCPQPLSDESAHPSTFALADNGALMNSLGTCLTQEMGRFNLLLARLVSTLKNIQKAVKGTIVMTGALDQMFTSIINNVIPSNWGNVQYPSLKPLSSFYEDLILRVEFFREWIEN